LSFSSPFAILVNCFYPNPQVLPFPSNSPAHPTKGGGGVREQPCGSLVPAWVKPQQYCKNIRCVSSNFKIGGLIFSQTLLAHKNDGQIQLFSFIFFSHKDNPPAAFT